MADKVLDVFQVGGPFDRDNPRSLISIMPREAVRVLEEMPIEYLDMSEEELRKMVRPNPLLNSIRTAFWMEYDLAQSSGTKMTIKGIMAHMAGVAPSLLVRNSLEDEKKLAYILHPPMHYDTLIDESLSHGLIRIREILELPLYDGSGKLDHKAAELILKATAFLDIRKNGMPTQRIDQTTKSLNVQVTKADMKVLGTTRPEELDKRIKELEAELSG